MILCLCNTNSHSSGNSHVSETLLGIRISDKYSKSRKLTEDPETEFVPTYSAKALAVCLCSMWKSLVKCPSHVTKQWLVAPLHVGNVT